MKTPYNVSLPIEKLFNQIKDGVEFLSAGDAPFTRIQVMNTAFNVIFTTGIFNDNYKIGKMQPAANKTWAQFKIGFFPWATKSSLNQLRRCNPLGSKPITLNFSKAP